MSVVTEAQMVPTVPGDKGTSKLYSFYGHFMMPAARLTAGMLTVLSVASPFRAQGQEHNTPPHPPTLVPPHTQCGDVSFKAASWSDRCSQSLNASSASPARLGLYSRRKLILTPPPRPLFPAGIKGLSDTCDPGNTFTGPKWGHHSNWR